MDQQEINIGDKVAYYDYLMVPQKGIIVYMKPHISEPGIWWLAIQDQERPDLNVIDVVKSDTGEILMVAAYMRSDQVYPLKEEKQQ